MILLLFCWTKKNLVFCHLGLLSLLNLWNMTFTETKTLPHPLMSGGKKRHCRPFGSKTLRGWTPAGKIEELWRLWGRCGWRWLMGKINMKYLLLENIYMIWSQPSSSVGLSHWPNRVTNCAQGGETGRAISWPRNLSKLTRKCFNYLPRCMDTASGTSSQKHQNMWALLSVESNWAAQKLIRGMLTHKHTRACEENSITPISSPPRKGTRHWRKQRNQSERRGKENKEGTGNQHLAFFFLLVTTGPRLYIVLHEH